MGRRKRAHTALLADDENKPANGDTNTAGHVWCTCDPRCSGGRFVGRSTWYSHAMFRSGDAAQGQDSATTSNVHKVTVDSLTRTFD